jgi:amino acid permease
VPFLLPPPSPSFIPRQEQTVVVSLPPNMDHEKSLPHDEKAAVQAPATSVGETPAEWREQESFMTRNGLNLTSFKRRPVSNAMVILDKSMKTRHLNMIAIGGSIGAGFFVGSGGAFNKGVSSSLPCYLMSCHLLTQYRALLLSSLISLLSE